MATTTMVRPTRVLQDVRDFRLEENRAWVARVLENGRSLGVRLDVTSGPFGKPLGKFFTNDDGHTFGRAVFDSDNGFLLKIILNASEKNPDTLETLQQIFKIWHAASGYSDGRAKVRRTCAGLMELLNSLSQTCQTLPYLQVVGSVSETSQTAPDGEFQQVEDRLAELLESLSATDAGDGEGIINPSRFEQFLSDQF